MDLDLRHGEHQQFSFQLSNESGLSKSYFRILALAWTPVTLDLPNSRHVSSGPELDLKFHNAEVAALCAGEGVLVRFFSPACSAESRTWAGSTSKCKRTRRLSGHHRASSALDHGTAPRIL